MKDCDLLEKCGFFKKYQLTKELACKGFIRQFCQGEHQNTCQRKAYRLEHGTPPPEDMMPNGAMVQA